MKKCFHNIVLRSIFIALFICFLRVSARDVADKDSYRSHSMGDEAFRDGDYKSAIEYYKEYKEEAFRNSDMEAYKDSQYCLISSFLRSSDADSAKKELEHLRNYFPDEKSITLRMYKAEIFIHEKEYSKAKDIYTSIIEQNNIAKNYYNLSISGLGYCLIQLKEWGKAIQIFSLLESKSDEPKWKIRAFTQKVYAMLMFDDIASAEKELKSASADKILQGLQETVALNLFLMAKKGDYKKLVVQYKEKRKNFVLKANPILYSFTSFASEGLTKKGMNKEAIEITRDSFYFAGTSKLKQAALKMLINVQAVAGNKKEAVSLINKYLNYFPESTDIHILKQQLARLYFDTGESKKSLSIYDELMRNSDLSDKFKIEIAKESSRIMIELRDYPGAKKRLLYIVKHGGDEKEKAEGEYMIAQLLIFQKRHLEAATEFLKIADKFKSKRKEALYQALQSYFALKNFRKVVSIGDIITENFPSTETARDTLFFQAISLKSMGLMHKAKVEFDRLSKNYPNHTYAAEAISESAEISYKLKKFDDAVKSLSKLIKDYPSSSLVPYSLYKRRYIYYLMDNIDKAIEDIQLLGKDYAYSKYAIDSYFWLSDMYYNQGKSVKAIELLDTMRTLYKDKVDVSAKIIYEKAYIYFKTGDKKNAIKFLNLLAEKFPDEYSTADGLYLMGDIISRDGDYSKAITFYQKAASERADSELETACWGREADCSFSIYSSTFDTKLLTHSVELYEKILAKKRLGKDLINQTLYKLGRSYELMGHEGTALEKYKKLIYGYSVDRKRRVLKQLWVVKAAKAAVAIYLKRDKLEDAKQAIIIYKKMKEFGITPGVYSELIKNIEDKFKI